MTSGGTSTKAAVLYETGQPLVVEHGLVWTTLQPSHVLVRIAYSGVCRSQLMEVRGCRGEDRFLPHLLGHEGAGTVMAVGSGVRKVGPGDAVVLTWIPGRGGDAGGTELHRGDRVFHAGPVTTFTEYTVVPENRCVRLPDGMPLDVAAVLGCAGLTGTGMVYHTLRPVGGSAIAVWGCGGIGLCAILAARHAGCTRVVAVDVAEPNLRLAGELGATDLVNARHTDARQEILRLTAGQGVDYAAESSGRAETIVEAFRSVRSRGGQLVFASHPPRGELIALDPFDLICGRNIRGSWGGDAQPDEDVLRLAELHRQGRFPLERLIGRRYSLDRVNDALTDLDRDPLGRALIDMSL